MEGSLEAPMANRELDRGDTEENLGALVLTTEDTIEEEMLPNYERFPGGHSGAFPEDKAA